MIEEADQVNTSIWPGMSIKKIEPSLRYLDLAVMALTMFSGWAVYKLSAVKMAPLGPSLYSFMTLDKEEHTFL